MALKENLIFFLCGGILCSLYFLLSDNPLYKFASFKSLKKATNYNGGAFDLQKQPTDRAECLRRHKFNLRSHNFPEDPRFLKTDLAKSYKKIFAVRWFETRYGMGFGYQPFEEACCEERRCYITAKRTIPMKEFDAILFQGEMISCSFIPKERSSHQRWIYYAKEPSIIALGNLKKLSKINFNWTMTFRTDSDVVARYGHILRKDSFPLNMIHEREKAELLESHLQSKTKLVAWFVSHCETFSKREKYVQNLQDYIKVDIFGDCGPLKCSQNNRTQCYEMLEGDYKFYLSFENSFCKDYITEKFFNIMKYNIVPVVRGFGDYKSIAPPHSYIDTRDFAKPKDLANYLLYLDNNDTAYAEYFKWKKEYSVLSNFEEWLSPAMNFCNLCKKLHEDDTPKSYPDFKAWFLAGSQCSGIQKRIMGLNFL